MHARMLWILTARITCTSGSSLQTTPPRSGLAARKNARALAQRGPYTGCAVEDEDAGKDESDHVDRQQRRPRAQLLHDPHDG